MKELTVETVVRLTEIIQVPDDQADDFVLAFKDKDKQRETAKDIKERLGADDAAISGVKVFVRDMPEKTKKTRKKKA